MNLHEIRQARAREALNMLKSVPIQSHPITRVGDEPKRDDVLHIELGAYDYEVALVDEPQAPKGEQFISVLQPGLQRIEVARRLPTDKRWACCWEHLAQAWCEEFDIVGDEKADYGDETVSNLVGLAMAHMKPTTMLQLWLFIVHGVAADRDAQLTDALEAVVARTAGDTAKPMRQDH
jgi:hypothetical protein